MQRHVDATKAWQLCNTITIVLTVMLFSLQVHRDITVSNGMMSGC